VEVGVEAAIGCVVHTCITEHAGFESWCEAGFTCCDYCMEPKEKEKHCHSN